MGGYRGGRSDWGCATGRRRNRRSVRHIWGNVRGFATGSAATRRVAIAGRLARARFAGRGGSRCVLWPRVWGRIHMRLVVTHHHSFSPMRSVVSQPIRSGENHRVAATAWKYMQPSAQRSTHSPACRSLGVCSASALCRFARCCREVVAKLSRRHTSRSPSLGGILSWALYGTYSCMCRIFRRLAERRRNRSRQGV